MQYLSCGHHISDWMDTQTKNIICVGIVESLLVLLAIIHNPKGSYMVDNLSTLSVEKIVPTIVPSVA